MPHLKSLENWIVLSVLIFFGNSGVTEILIYQKQIKLVPSFLPFFSYFFPFYIIIFKIILFLQGEQISCIS